MKNVLNFIVGIVLCFISFSANATVFAASCQEIKGLRIEYFTENPAGKKNNTFIESSDSVTNSQLTLRWNEDMREAELSIDDAAYLGTKKTNSAKLIKLFSDTQQISFVGILNNAPIMVTLYPRSNVVIYNIQSNWGSLATGIRANLFHAVCKPDK